MIGEPLVSYKSEVSIRQDCRGILLENMPRRHLLVLNRINDIRLLCKKKCQRISTKYQLTVFCQKLESLNSVYYCSLLLYFSSPAVNHSLIRNHGILTLSYVCNPVRCWNSVLIYLCYAFMVTIRSLYTDKRPAQTILRTASVPENAGAAWFSNMKNENEVVTVGSWLPELPLRFVQKSNLFPLERTLFGQSIPSIA